MSPSLGRHLLIELHGCDSATLDNLDALRTALLDAAVATGATVLGDRFHQFTPHGVSGIVLISESHLAVHTWPEHGYAAVDLFTCGETSRPERAFGVLKSHLHSEVVYVSEVARGLREHLTVPSLPPPTRIEGAPAAPAVAAPAYQPLHPAIFKYDERFVERFIVPKLARPAPSDARALVEELAEQIYRFPLFTPEFCRLLIEECEHAGAWRTVLGKTIEAHGALDGIDDLIEPETAIAWKHMPGLEAVYDAVIANHVRPVLEGLWKTFKLQKWDPPAVRKFEPDVVAGMDLHYDAETVGMIGYLSNDFEGGGTHFPRWELTVGRGGTVLVGSVVCYPGGVSHEHLALPVTRGARYMLSNSFY